MLENDEKWPLHEEKAVKALEEARFLFESGFYDGACIRAIGSCVQIAKSVAIRLENDRDEKDWKVRIRRMIMDGRLPASLQGPFKDIMTAHSLETETSRSRDATRATEMIELAETFTRLMKSASALTVSMNSPEVKQAMAARGLTPQGMMARG
ncbi:HEPN domain-containing protein [Sinorhizobium meliloti]|nr:HEPN domain-containing protein [Sinorhizobium meliloti]